MEGDVMRRSLRNVCAIVGWAYAVGMVLSVSAAQNPCVKNWQWQWKIPPSLEITAPSPIPDQCLGAISIGPATVTATAGVKWEVDINNCPEPPATRNETTVPITPQNTWDLYSCPAGTTPLSGNGTTAQFTTIHAGSVVVQFKSQASVASPPWSALVAARTSPFGTGPEITEPDQDPVTDNNFTFTYTPGQAWPNGACNITPHAIRGSDVQWLEWQFPDVAGCIKSVTLGNWPYEYPVLTYSRLPNSNGSFGNKVVTVKRKPDNCTDTVTVQIFFSGADDAVNHPGTGTGVTPNWYFYWKHTTASWGDPIYATSAAPGITEDDWAWTNWSPPDQAYKAFLWHRSNDTSIPPDGPYRGTNYAGIDTFGYACRHEARHVTCDTAWWPNGPDTGQGGLGVWPTNPVDSDTDFLPDTLEPTLGAAVGGPYTAGVRETFPGILDGERYTHFTQSQWRTNSAKAQDWSNPGQQSNE